MRYWAWSRNGKFVGIVVCGRSQYLALKSLGYVLEPIGKGK